MVCLDFRRVAPVTVISGPSSNPAHQLSSYLSFVDPAQPGGGGLNQKTTSS